jgi:hypothetical protein
MHEDILFAVVEGEAFISKCFCEFFYHVDEDVHKKVETVAS